MNDEGYCCTLAVDELERSLCGASGLYTEYPREVRRSNTECSEAIVVGGRFFVSTLCYLTIGIIDDAQC